MDSGYINGVLFLDLKKTFDTVDYKLLLRKLYLHGKRGIALDWFTSYINNRLQVCKIYNYQSETSLRKPKPVQQSKAISTW